MQVMRDETTRNPPRPQTGAVRLSPLQAVQRNLGAVIVPVVVLVAAAVAVGLGRTPTYSSDAQLNVGGVNLSIQAIPGYSVAVQQLATAYSRAIDARAVVRPVARRAHMSQQDVIDSVSATPVEGSPVIRIHAEAPTARKATRLANAAADTLAAYATRLNRANPDTPRLQRQYVAQSTAVRRAAAAFRGAGPQERKRAQARLDLARLRLRTTALLFQQSQAGGATTSFVQKLAPASSATSDRSSVLQRLVIAALIAGAVIGVGLAVARSGRDSRRRLAAS